MFLSKKWQSLLELPPALHLVPALAWTTNEQIRLQFATLTPVQLHAFAGISNTNSDQSARTRRQKGDKVAAVGDELPILADELSPISPLTADICNQGGGV
jgi:hypothetical protein